MSRTYQKTSPPGTPAQWHEKLSFPTARAGGRYAEYMHEVQLVSDSDGLGYDPTDRVSILHFAQRLLGHRLSDFVPDGQLEDPRVRKGHFGNALEEQYFKIPANSRREADFSQASLELKSTPLKLGPKGKVTAKERLVLGMIDYSELVNEEFLTSSLIAKTALMLLVAYVYRKEVNPIDYKILMVLLWGLHLGECEGVPPELCHGPSKSDFLQFQHDWECIQNKVRDGKAHEISCGDTVYLEACPKAKDSSVTRSQPCSRIPAKPRAWALKASYMTTVFSKQYRNFREIPRSADEQQLDLFELVSRRFEPYIGKTEAELAELTGYDVFAARKPKNLNALITKKILGVSEQEQIAEFEKAGIKPKTLRLNSHGKPKEHMSLPLFRYSELVQNSFKDSTFYGQVQQKYLFVIFREANRGEFRLDSVAFWQMPESDLLEAKECYDLMRARVKAGCGEDSVKVTENRCCHVRPHARNAKDTLPAPDGKGGEKPLVKKCFWLNAGYLQAEIRRISEQPNF